MNEKFRAILQAQLLSIVANYVETMEFVINKNIIGNKRPQAWQVENAYQNMPQTIIQMTAQAANPVPVQQGSGIADILKLLQSGTEVQTQQQPPPAQPGGNWVWTPTP